MQVAENARKFLAQIEFCKKEVGGSSDHCADHMTFCVVQVLSLVALWRSLRDHVSIKDELAMSKMTLQLVAENQEIAEHEQLYKVCSLHKTIKINTFNNTRFTCTLILYLILGHLSEHCVSGSFV